MLRKTEGLETHIRLVPLTFIKSTYFDKGHLVTGSYAPTNALQYTIKKSPNSDMK